MAGGPGEMGAQAQVYKTQYSKYISPLDFRLMQQSSQKASSPSVPTQGIKGQKAGAHRPLGLFLVFNVSFQQEARSPSPSASLSFCPFCDHHAVVDFR